MVLFFLATAWAQESTSGFAEVRVIGSVGVDGVPLQVVERLRPSFEYSFSDRVKLVATVDASLKQGRDLQTEVERTINDSDLGPLLDLAGCEWPEPPQNQVLGIDGAADWLVVDRLYADVYLPVADLRVGRQAVRWGSAFVVNPTDPFPEVLFAEPWRYRAGVNALRATVPLGAHQVQAVVGTDDSFTQVRLAGRGTVNVAATDFSVVGAWRSESKDGIVGLDVRGTLGVGYWFEGAVHIGEETYEELAVGLDYSFPVLERFVVTGQYYRNGRPPAEEGGGLGNIANAVELPDCGDSPAADLFPEPTPSNKFAPVFSGSDYLMLGVALQWIPEVSTNLSAVQNLADGSGTLVPTVSVSPLGWLDASLSAQVPYALPLDDRPGGELKRAPEDLVVGEAPLTLDLSGLVADTTLIFWTRASF